MEVTATVKSLNIILLNASTSLSTQNKSNLEKLRAESIAS